MTVKELVELLQQLPPEMRVNLDEIDLYVQWGNVLCFPDGGYAPDGAVTLQGYIAGRKPVKYEDLANLPYKERRKYFYSGIKPN